MGRHHLGHKRYGGWLPSLPDHRDRIADRSGLAILPEVDPRPTMPPIYDQGQLGSCTANAVAAAYQYDMHIDGFPLDLHRPSRLFLYYMERQIEGSLGQGDTGAMGRDGFKALQTYGWVPEREWRYVISRFDTKPPAALWTEAATRRMTKTYAAVAQDTNTIKAILSNQQTVAFGFTVYDSFESPEVAQSGVVPMPTTNEQTLGGHETLIVGYLQAQPNYALVRNSWGPNWGLRGYFLMPWQYICDPNLAGDHRTIVRPG
jgi:C1A family cysteine protease